MTFPNPFAFLDPMEEDLIYSLILHFPIFRKKSWAGDEDKVSGKITSSTKSMCSAVAKLTQWADRVITDGCVDPTEDYVNQGSIVSRVQFPERTLWLNIAIYASISVVGTSQISQPSQLCQP